MSNKKLFAIILSAVILTSVVTVAAYKIFTKNPETPSLTSNPNFESIVDTIDYSENLLDSNAVYKEKFDEDLTSQGKWIPVKSSDLIRELTSPPVQDEAPVVQNVSNENTARENTSTAENMAPADNQSVQEEVTNNISSENVKQETENKVTTVEKIVYIWQPNECSGSSWNPYTNGHWEFTYAGWVWASDYRWGRHCYNYGRWMWTSFYGWVWMPGGRWAPNWVTWRCNYNYNGGCYIGWYPTCPRLYWRDYHSNLVVCNSHFTSNPHHWTVVNQVNITKSVTNTTKIHPDKNAEILNNSGKVHVNTMAIDDRKIKYSGPNVNVINQVTKSTITPKSIEIPVNIDKNSAGTKTTVVSEPVTKVKVTKSTQINGNDLLDKIRKTNVSNPNTITNINNTGTTTTPPPTKNTTEPPIKTAGPSVNPPTKTEPPAKTVTPPTKSTTTPKSETPKQNPPTKQEPPKQNPPTKQEPPKQNPPPKYEPKYDPPVYNPPPPVKQDPPRQDTPKQDPPRQDPPKQDPPKQEPRGKQ